MIDKVNIFTYLDAYVSKKKNKTKPEKQTTKTLLWLSCCAFRQKEPGYNEEARSWADMTGKPERAYHVIVNPRVSHFSTHPIMTNEHTPADKN